MVATRGAGPSQASRLKFKEKLTGSNDVLQKKLKALYEELSQLEQGLVDTASLNTARKELISSHIILHKDKGIKAHAACCLADILRLYAPDAPYTAPELRDMFQFFFRQLAANFKAESPYYHQYFLLVESLSTVKSIVLVCDLPNAEELISMLFREFFHLMHIGDLGRNVEIYMSDMLVAVIDEAQTIPTDAVKNILAQFLPDASAASRRLATSVCNQTSDKLQRHVVQYFTDIMLASAASKGEDSDEEEQELDFPALRSAHNLIRSISLSAPSLLHNVIPQLETELRAEEVALRSLGTRTLGEMFSEPKTGSDLIKKYPTCWKVWVQRKVDKSPVVRVAWVESVKPFFNVGQELRDEIEEGISQKILDPDEKVRATVCKIVGELDHDVFMATVNIRHLHAIGQRTMDKKHIVRREAMHTLGKIWSTAYLQADDTDENSLNWIPNLILHAITHNIEAKQVAEEVIITYILPPPTKDVSDSLDPWATRLLTVWRDLDDRAITNLLNLTPIKTAHPSIYEHFLQACCDNNGGVIDKDEEIVKRRLSQTIQYLSSMYAESHKAAEDLYTFAKNNDQRQFRLLRTCMDPTIDVKTTSKSQAEFIKRIDQGQSSAASTLIITLRRASFWIINTSMIGLFLRRLEQWLARGTCDQRDLDAVQHIIKYVAKHCPSMLEAHSLELSKALTERSSRKKKGSPLVTQAMEIYLTALAGIAKGSVQNPDGPSRTTASAIDANVLRTAKSFVNESHPRHAKFAARLLAFSVQKQEVCAAIVKDMICGLESDEDEDQLETRVTVLAELSRAIPEAFESKSDTLTEFLYKRILVQPCQVKADMEDEDWLADEDIPALCRAKVQALKVCRNRCLSQSASPTALDIVTPALKLYLTLLRNEGSLSLEVKEPKGVASLLRLQAAASMLSLSAVELYQKSIDPYFVDLVLIIQDSSGDVRYRFLQKVINGLQQHRLHRNYTQVLFLTAVDPDSSIRDKAKAYILYAMRRLSQDQRLTNLELIFIRFLHLLAHHPDFDLNDLEGLKDFTKYLNFYLYLVSNADNLPLLYHIAGKVKTVRDGESEEHTKRLYVLSEIAQEMIKARSKQHSWPLPSYPGKIKLPADIFKPLPNPEHSNKINKQIFTPQGVLDWLEAEGGKGIQSPHPPKTKKVRDTGEHHATSGDEKDEPPSIPRKRKAKSGNPSSDPKRKRGRPPKKRKQEESEPEDSSDEDSESDSSPRHGRNGRQTPHRVKEESPPISKVENETSKPKAGMGLRTRASTKKEIERDE